MLHSSNKEYSNEQATKLGVNVYTGIADPIEAKSWIVKIERVFDVMGCPDVHKLYLVTFLLEGDAHDWWRSVQSKYVDPLVITWGDFNEYYYPHSYKNDK